jgi:hypothetical protein
MSNVMRFAAVLGLVLTAAACGRQEPEPMVMEPAPIVSEPTFSKM